MKSYPWIFPILLAGCALLPKPEPTLVQCIPVTTFTTAQQQKLSAALKQLPPDSPINDMAVDWEKMRAEARACSK